jgi:hypothetical protein
MPSLEEAVLSEHTIARTSGGILAAGAALFTLGYLLGVFGPSDATLSAAAVTSPIAIGSALAQFVGSTLVLVMLPTLVSRLIGRAPVLGILGGVGLGLVLLIQGVSNSFVDLTVFPWLIENPATRSLATGEPPSALLTFYTIASIGAFIGGILLGIAILRSPAFARWTGVLMIASGVLGPIGMLVPGPAGNIPAVLGGIALIGCGLRVARAAAARTQAAAVDATV